MLKSSRSTSTPLSHDGQNHVGRRATLRFLTLVVGGCLVAVGALLVGVGLLLPNQWHVQREILVSAPPGIILPLVNDFRQWAVWSKQKQDDPTLRYTYSGPEFGVGARRHYQGQHAGSGYSEIIRSDPAYGVAMTSAVGTTTPNAQSQIEFEPRGGTTAVIWTDKGEITSVFGVFLRANLEEELGEYMELSLTRLKSEAERRASGTK